MNRSEPLALYIHWPFCVSKCPYCDFNSHVRETVDDEAWQRALLSDLAYEAQQTQGGVLGSIFFGGGTPSLMPPSIAGALIEAAGRHWERTADCEITLEANPSSVEASRFADLARAGVNRISIGLQSLDDRALAFLGRAHGVDEALAAIDVAQQQFGRVSVDLIYARPGQSQAEWEGELNRALALGTSHLSLYQLTIEPGTRFETLVRTGEFAPLGTDEAAEMFELTRRITADHGIPAYEVSNHARSGQESRHNLTYWRYGSYAGVGPGAHGRRGGMATMRHKKPENYLSAVARNGHGCVAETPLTPAEQAREALVMGLRLAEGLDLERIKTATGIDTLINPDQAVMLVREGLITQSGHHITVTPAGMLLLDAILVALVAV